MTVAIIDYGSGNLRSAAKAFERQAGSGTPVRVTSDPDVVAGADRIVLPGVGAFADCKRGLEALDGMVDALRAAVVDRGRPFLGICVGMQLMAETGLEHGRHAGFGWIGGDVRAIAPADPALKVPHMGWNTLTLCAAHPVTAGLPDDAHVYFVHSYHLAPSNIEDLLATTDHGGTLTAMVGRDNMVGTQFHPEKSQEAGLALIANFLAWAP
ncbi:MAG: imidazole glycerol phosphate synthase subunit HisH [Alphaproteobacteria bacterium]|nr:imidazole glycerol phosphate synthase subunit HisH [Alphaproteobacteria bacterium]